MSVLVSAPIRTGKTLFTVKKIFEELNRGRMVYTNIVGINIEGVISVSSSIDDPFDWRNLPNGSVLVWDEAHEHPAFAEQDLLKNLKLSEAQERIFDERIENVNNSDLVQTRKKQLIDKINAERKHALVQKKEDILDIGRSLLLHGHFGIEIYFITQRVTRLNSDVLASVTNHFVLRRKFGFDAATIWEFGEAMTSWSKSTADSALNKTFWRYPKHLYKFYKSSENHQVRKTFPLKYAAFALIPILLFAKGFAGAKETGFFGVFGKSKTEQVQQQPKQQAQNSAVSASASPVANAKPNFDVTVECRKAENLDKQECKAWFDSLSKNNQSVSAMNNPNQLGYSQSNMQSVSYNPADPYDDKDIKSKLQYQVTSQPKFAGCMKTSTGYRAYTEQGTYLKASKSVCDRLMQNSGDRPYDYFRSNSSASFGASNLSTASDSDNNSKTKDAKQQAVDSSPVYNIPSNPSFPEKDITKPSV